MSFGAPGSDPPREEEGTRAAVLAEGAPRGGSTVSSRSRSERLIEIPGPDSIADITLISVAVQVWTPQRAQPEHQCDAVSETAQATSAYARHEQGAPRAPRTRDSRTREQARHENVSARRHRGDGKFPESEVSRGCATRRLHRPGCHSVTDPGLFSPPTASQSPLGRGTPRGALRTRAGHGRAGARQGARGAPQRVGATPRSNPRAGRASALPRARTMAHSVDGVSSAQWLRGNRICPSV